MLNNLLKMHLKLLQEKVTQKRAEAAGDLTGNKISDKIKRVSKTLPQNNSKENIEHDREIHKERYISPEQRQKIIDDLRLV